MLGWALCSLREFDLYLSYYFNVNAVHSVFPEPVDVSWFFIGEPVFNFGGFFVDGSEPTIYRLPSVMFLLWASITLCRYLKDNRTFFQAFFAAILLGGVGGLIVVLGTKLLFAFKIDDVVGAIPAHLFAGIWGTLAVPLTNADASFSAQLIGVLAVNIFVFIVALIIWTIMKNTMGIRLSKEAEKLGTDVAETGVIAYAIRD